MEADNSCIQSISTEPHNENISLEENFFMEPQVNNESEKRNLNKDMESFNKDKEAEMVMVELEDDQESVIVKEVRNKTIELDEDSSNEIELVEKSVTDSPYHTKATEFVIVNAANTSLNNAGNEKEVVTRYAADNLLIKDELAETINADLNANDVLENDPMDLLELNNRSVSPGSTRSQDVEDYGDDMSTSSAQTGSSSTLSTLNWLKDYPWLLYEDGDDLNGHCLYCDAKLNIKSQKTVKQHGLSLYHKERSENYLAFREEEEKNGISYELVEIKQEFGTDSCVQALKLKRKSQTEAFNNFNWRRWLRDYSWLERDSPEGTIGYCKYCQIHLNVEFSYLRDRHQESSKHKDLEKQQQPKPNLENHRWAEVLETEPNATPLFQCKLCKTKVLKNNFLRHLGTNIHMNNEKIYQETQRAAVKKISEDGEDSKNQYNWKVYANQHPWLISDPIDPKYAYCKYCEKRIIYGTSASKRSLHENSSQHKYNESVFKSQGKSTSDREINQKKSKSKEENKEGVKEQDRDDGDEVKEDNENEEDRNAETTEEEKDEDDEEGEEEAEQEEEEEEAEQEEEEEDSEEDIKKKNVEENDDSKKRAQKLTEEWFNQYAWCAKYDKDPKNYFFCIYCKIPLKATYSRVKHHTSAGHITAEEDYIKKQEKRPKSVEKKQNIGNDDHNYEWAVPLKGNINMYSCKYCRVRISKNCSKKSHAASKIHQINESIFNTKGRKPSRQEEEKKIVKPISKATNISTSRKEQTFAKVMIKVPSTLTMIKQWQKKFPWLSYKRNELRSNYGYCKICDSSLYLRSLKHVFRHARSGRHISLTKEQKKHKVEQEHEDDSSVKIKSKGPKQESQTSPEQTKDSLSNKTNPNELHNKYNYRSTIIELKKRFSWIESSEKANYGYCRFCNANIPLKILFLRNHSNSQKHRFCVKNYNGEDQRKYNTNDDEGEKHVDNNDDEDVMLVEENNEEILISEQDENWTVKSETMDEHEELDFLLQRSFNINQNKTNSQRTVRKSTGNEEHPQPKRIKMSQSFKRLNDSNSSLVASLLSTPLTLASCLGPLIQQQIQQVGNQQTMLANSSTPVRKETVLQTESENTFDLFFKSVSETMKKLPVDIAAEGKVRVMQILCDLELQAFKRQQAVPTDSSNTSGLNYQPISSSLNAQLGGTNANISNSNHELSTAEQSFVGNDTIITQVHADIDMSPPATATTTQTGNKNLSLTSTAVNQSTEKLHSTTSTSPIIGVMDRNGLQTIQLKTSIAKQVPRSTSNTTVTTVANPGIRCIPFKNLSQPITPDARIQVPLNVTPQFASGKSSPVTTPKNVINFRNIQITKRIGTVPTSTSSSSANIINGVQQQQQQQLQQQQKQSSTMIKSPQRTYITNMQPQMQRWTCSVNGSSSQQTPTTSAVNQISQQTSTPVLKRN